MTSDGFEAKGITGPCRLFPLPGVVLFPHAVIPLHIFEPRYRQMTEHALASDSLITLVQPSPHVGWPIESDPLLLTVGCTGRIVAHERLEDGRYNFLLFGLKRVRIVRELECASLYRQAEVELIEDVDDVAEPAPSRAELTRLFRSFLGNSVAVDPELDKLLLAETPLGILSDVLAYSLSLPAAVKQKMLEEPRVSRRVDTLKQALLKAVQARSGTQERTEFPPPFSLN